MTVRVRRSLVEKVFRLHVIDLRLAGKVLRLVGRVIRLVGRVLRLNMNMKALGLAEITIRKAHRLAGIARRMVGRAYWDDLNSCAGHCN